MSINTANVGRVQAHGTLSTGMGTKLASWQLGGKCLQLVLIVHWAPCCSGCRSGTISYGQLPLGVRSPWDHAGSSEHAEQRQSTMGSFVSCLSFLCQGVFALTNSSHYMFLRLLRPIPLLRLPTLHLPIACVVLLSFSVVPDKTFKTIQNNSRGKNT